MGPEVLKYKPHIFAKQNSSKKVAIVYLFQCISQWDYLSFKDFYRVQKAEEGTTGDTCTCRYHPLPAL